MLGFKIFLILTWGVNHTIIYYLLKIMNVQYPSIYNPGYVKQLNIDEEIQFFCVVLVPS